MSDTKYTSYYYELIEKYKDFHTNGTKNLSGKKTFLGYSLTPWIEKISEIIKELECNSLLDFGCGKAFLYNNSFKFKGSNYLNLQDYFKIKDLILYDPAVEIYSRYPDKNCDGVICTDVIEHIPEEDIFNFIDEIFKLANKFIFLVIATVPASKYFDDGKNIHLCVKTKDEWNSFFEQFKEKYPHIKQFIFYNEGK